MSDSIAGSHKQKSKDSSSSISGSATANLASHKKDRKNKKKSKKRNKNFKVPITQRGDGRESFIDLQYTSYRKKNKPKHPFTLPEENTVQNDDSDASSGSFNHSGRPEQLDLRVVGRDLLQEQLPDFEEELNEPNNHSTQLKKLPVSDSIGGSDKKNISGPSKIGDQLAHTGLPTSTATTSKSGTSKKLSDRNNSNIHGSEIKANMDYTGDAETIHIDAFLPRKTNLTTDLNNKMESERSPSNTLAANLDNTASKDTVTVKTNSNASSVFNSFKDSQPIASSVESAIIKDVDASENPASAIPSLPAKQSSGKARHLTFSEHSKVPKPTNLTTTIITKASSLTNSHPVQLDSQTTNSSSPSSKRSGSPIPPRSRFVGTSLSKSPNLPAESTPTYESLFVTSPRDSAPAQKPKVAETPVSPAGETKDNVPKTSFTNTRESESSEALKVVSVPAQKPAIADASTSLMSSEENSTQPTNTFTSVEISSPTVSTTTASAVPSTTTKSQLNAKLSHKSAGSSISSTPSKIISGSSINPLTASKAAPAVMTPGDANHSLPKIPASSHTRISKEPTDLLKVVSPNAKASERPLLQTNSSTATVSAPITKTIFNKPEKNASIPDTKDASCFPVHSFSFKPIAPKFSAKNAITDQPKSPALPSSQSFRSINEASTTTIPSKAQQPSNALQNVHVSSQNMPRVRADSSLKFPTTDSRDLIFSSPKPTATQQISKFILINYYWCYFFTLITNNIESTVKQAVAAGGSVQPTSSTSGFTGMLNVTIPQFF
jgi:hypothetical protein